MSGKRGPTDPGRRDRIARAAIEVVAKRGVEGLTHRAVADAAGVPLGSTTYHFKGLDDLLQAAMEHAMARDGAALEAWLGVLPDGVDLVTQLTRLLCSVSSPAEGSGLVLEYELYVAALRRPALQPTALAWAATLPRLLSRHTDRVTARALSATCDGLLLESLLTGRALTRRGVTTVLRRIVD